MRVLSLFDGISCGQVALDQLSIPVEVYFASEIDKYAIQIAQKNYPATIQIGDVRNVCWQSIGHCELLLGGSILKQSKRLQNFMQKHQKNVYLVK